MQVWQLLSNFWSLHMEVLQRNRPRVMGRSQECFRLLERGVVQMYHSIKGVGVIEIFIQTMPFECLAPLLPLHTTVSSFDAKFYSSMTHIMRLVNEPDKPRH